VLDTAGNFTGTDVEAVLAELQDNIDAGGGGTFTPLDIPGLAGWWDASDAATITASAGAVSQWNDKSGNGYHVTQATGTKKPTTGTRTINSLNVLDFDGGDGLQKASGVIPAPLAIYVVVEPDTVSGTDLIFHGGTAGVADWSFFLSDGVPSFFGGSGTVSSGSLSAGTAVLLRNRHGSGGAFNQMWTAGAEGTAAATGGTAYGNVEIGANDAIANCFDGKIAEVIFVGVPVGGPTDVAIREYLADKWGVTA